MKSIFPSMCLLIALAFCQSALGQEEEFVPTVAPGVTPPSLADNRAAKAAVSNVNTIEYGRMTVTVDINEAGHVTRVRSVSGPGNVCPSTTRPGVIEIRNVAISAAKTVTFNPARLDGRPAPSSGRLYFYIDTRPRPPIPASEAPENFTGNLKRAAGPGDVREDNSKETPIRSRSAPLPADYASTPPVRGSGPPPVSSGSDPESVSRIAISGDIPLTAGDGSFSGGILNGKAISLPRPTYPPAARAVRASGPVLIQVIIDEDGTIYSATATSGNPLLRTAARMAACEAKFAPTLFQGKPVKVQGIITYNFVAP